LIEEIEKNVLPVWWITLDKKDSMNYNIDNKKMEMVKWKSEL
jgi:hypothetical protein